MRRRKSYLAVAGTNQPNRKIRSLKEPKFEPGGLEPGVIRPKKANQTFFKKVESTGRKQKGISILKSWTAKQEKGKPWNCFFNQNQSKERGGMKREDTSSWKVSGIPKGQPECSAIKSETERPGAEGH
jgi:hypothetical protein